MRITEETREELEQRVNGATWIEGVDWIAPEEVASLLADNREKDAQLAAMERRVGELEAACRSISDSVEQTLGKVLGFPWYKDDQENFPGATEENGVCVGPYTAVDVAELAAKRIAELESLITGLEQGIPDYWKDAIGESYTPAILGNHVAAHAKTVKRVLESVRGTEAADVIASLAHSVCIAWNNAGHNGETAMEKTIEADELRAERDNALKLLRRIREWDQLPQAADGAFWASEIDALPVEGTNDATEG